MTSEIIEFECSACGAIDDACRIKISYEYGFNESAKKPKKCPFKGKYNIKAKWKRI